MKKVLKKYKKALKFIMKSKIKDKYLKKLGIVHKLDMHIMEEINKNINMSKHTIR